MKLFKLFFLITLLILELPLFAKSESILKEFKIEQNEKGLNNLRAKVLKLGKDAIPDLITIMKSSEYPENNRWVATFLLGRIAGNGASTFIAKFLEHPNFLMRLAALKTLLVLKERKYEKEYANLLRDPSLLVRYAALENIKRLKLVNQAPAVWNMMFDENNYSGKKGERKRTNIIKRVILVVGELNYHPIKPKLLSMTQKREYFDLMNELDYSLSLMTQKKSPKGDLNSKKEFWSNQKII